MLSAASTLVCPWCGNVYERSTDTDPEPEMETSRSPLMAVLRMRSQITSECSKCHATCRVVASLEQLWDIPPGGPDAA